MQVDLEERADVLIVKPRFSRLDAAAASSFRDTVAARLARQRVVVFVMTNVEFMDSSGLGSIVSLLKRLPAGTLVRLAEVPTPLQKLLHLTRLDKVFPSFASLELALA